MLPKSGADFDPKIDPFCRFLGPRNDQFRPNFGSNCANSHQFWTILKKKIFFAKTLNRNQSPYVALIQAESC